MTAIPLKTCLCCGREIIKDQFCAETPDQFAKRYNGSWCRAKCKRNLPSPSPKDRPTLVADPTAWNLERPEIRAVEKELTPRDSAYLDWIRSFDCIGCGWPAHMGHVESHHIETGGTSIRCSDYLTVPLCSFEARGCHPAADKTPESVERFRPWALRFNALWIAAGNKIKKRKA